MMVLNTKTFRSKKHKQLKNSLYCSDYLQHIHASDYNIILQTVVNLHYP